MQTKLYTGNLPYEVSEGDLEQLFSKYGTVKSATIIRDAYSGRSKGFGFVEMSEPAEAEKALEQNGQEFKGRTITVSEARPLNKDSRGGGEGRRFGGGGGGGRSGGFGGGGNRRNRY